MSEMSALPQVFVLVDREDILSHILPRFCLQVSCIIQHKQTKESEFFLTFILQCQIMIYFTSTIQTLFQTSDFLSSHLVFP